MYRWVMKKSFTFFFFFFSYMFMATASTKTSGTVLMSITPVQTPAVVYVFFLGFRIPRFHGIIIYNPVVM